MSTLRPDFALSTSAMQSLRACPASSPESIGLGEPVDTEIGRAHV